MEVVDIEYEKLISNAKDFGLVEMNEAKSWKKKNSNGKEERYTPFLALTQSGTPCL